MTRVFISDCEGPISKNDNALEATSHFVPHGKKIFTITSRYDDVLADLVRKPNYKAGDTLKLILPFLKAYNVTDQLMKEFSQENLLLIPEVSNSLAYIKGIMPTYIISTSYEQYIQAVCKAIDFPLENTYSTKLHLDKYDIKDKEKSQLKQICEEIWKMQTFDVLEGAKNLNELPPETQTTIHRLDQIFWDTIEKMQIGQIYSDVNPVGGIEKAEAIRDVVRRLSTTLRDVMYVGDSITDKEAFRLVKKNDGLAVSFNGNRYAIENADIAVMSRDSGVTAVIAETFLRSGKKVTLDLVANWNRRTLEKTLINDTLKKRFLRMHPRELPKTKIITTENRGKLAKESSLFRSKIRGEIAGRLG